MDEKALQQCRARIEQKLGWGEASDWTTREFEDLSLRIQETTGSAISATTLKRVWGRVAYDSRPSRHTLDTLVAFLDYPSWRTFTKTVEEDGVSQHVESGMSAPILDATASSRDTATSISDAATSTGEASDSTGKAADSSGKAMASTGRAPASLRRASSHLKRFGRLSPRLRYAGGSVLILLSAFALWAGLNTSTDASRAGLNASTDLSRADPPAHVRFDSRPVSQGLPNTVIFEYDVRGIRADSFFIQQSWDESRRARISPERQTFASTYYEPGYFNATLIADTTVMSAHAVHVTTDGWLALVEKDPLPIYLPGAHEPGRGYLTISKDLLRERHTDAGSNRQVVSFYNVRTFDSLHTDRFTLNTVVRHGVDDGRYPCRRAELAVIGERSAIAVAVGIPGCAGDLGAMFGDVYLDGSSNDLSALGADLSTWQRVQIVVKDRNVNVRVGSNSPFTSRFTMDIGRVVGLQYRFEGNGAIDHVALKDGEGRLVYEEAF